MAIRKIYVRQGEMVEIRVVPEDGDLNASEWKYQVHPFKYLVKFFKSGIDVCVAQAFHFTMAGRPMGTHKEDS